MIPDFLAAGTRWRVVGWVVQVPYYLNSIFVLVAQDDICQVWGRRKGRG